MFSKTIVFNDEITSYHLLLSVDHPKGTLERSIFMPSTLKLSELSEMINLSYGLDRELEGSYDFEDFEVNYDFVDDYLEDLLMGFDEDDFELFGVLNPLSILLTS